MTYLDSLILGVVEGLTEFLPVSSTGHLILVSSLLGIPDSSFLTSFEIAIQLGSILAVVVLYWKSFLDSAVLKRVLIAFIPTGIVGFLLYSVIKGYLLGNEMVVVIALGLGGVAILAIEYFHKHQTDTERPVHTLSYKESFLVGLAQSLAVVPGVSRSGATVMGGLLLGIPRTTVLTFSFLLAVPTMLMATLYDLYKTPTVFEHANLTLLAVGFVTAFVVALITIRLALRIVRTYTFVPFAIYRILLALVFWFVIL